MCLVDRLPDERGRPTVVRHDVERNRRLVVFVELRPIERDEQLFPFGDNERNPLREPLPDHDAPVAQQPVDLLDRGFGSRLIASASARPIA